MKAINFIFIFLIFACVLASYEYVDAQQNVSRGVFGNGGAALDNGSYRLQGTAGQPAIGIVSSPSHISDVGFWYQSSVLITNIYQTTNNLPTTYRLEQNYPNPFNPTTTICYSLPECADVTLQVLTLLGQPVTELVRARQTTGFYSRSFDASDLASGVYFYRLEAHGIINWSQTRKFVFLK